MSRKGQKAVSEVSGASLVGSETFDDRIYIMIKIVKVSHHYRNIFVDGVFTAMMFKNVYGNWILQYGYATTVVLADGRRCTRYHVEDYEALVTALEKGRI